MDEGKAVAAAAGVELHEDPWEMNVARCRRGETLAAEGHYAHVPSMLEDVRAGRRPRSTSSPARSSARRPTHGVPVPLHIGDVPAREGPERHEDRRDRLRGGGSLFAANLGTLDDVEVWAYDPWQEHVDAINANGLRLSGAGEVVGRVHATTDPAALPPCDLGIVAMKSQHTSAAMAAIAHAFETARSAPSRTAPATRSSSPSTSREVIRGRRSRPAT